MDNLISNGAVFSFSEFSALIKENSIDAVHDSIAQLSDSNCFFRILELGEIKLSWDDNASTLCNYDGEDYYIMEFLDLVKNLSNNEILQRDKREIKRI